MNKKKLGVFFATVEDQKKTSNMVINILGYIDKSSTDFLFKSYVMQMLMESFEEIYKIDIRRSVSFKYDKKKDLDKVKTRYLKYNKDGGSS